MRGDNKVVMWGNIGADPEVKTLESGLKIANISVPSVESKKDKGTGEWENKTHWHRVTLFGSLAINAEKYLKKGQGVFIEAKLKNNSWKDENDKMQYRTDIVATSLQVIGGVVGGNNIQDKKIINNDDLKTKERERAKEIDTNFLDGMTTKENIKDDKSVSDDFDFDFDSVVNDK